MNLPHLTHGTHRHPLDSSVRLRRLSGTWWIHYDGLCVTSWALFTPGGGCVQVMPSMRLQNSCGWSFCHFASPKCAATIQNIYPHCAFWRFRVKRLIPIIYIRPTSPHIWLQTKPDLPLFHFGPARISPFWGFGQPYCRHIDAKLSS